MHKECNAFAAGDSTVPAWRCRKFVNWREFFMKHVKILNGATLKNSACKGGCGECQTSCQSACKTSCTVANQKCENNH